MNLRGQYVLATELMKRLHCAGLHCASPAKHFVTSGQLKHLSFCNQGMKGNCQSQITGLAIS